MNEQEKEQALKLSALFKELHDKGTWFERCLGASSGRWGRTGGIPDMKANLSLWRVADKPVESKKIINLTKMVGSDIDMEFGKNTLVIGKLADIDEWSDHVIYSMNHKQKGWYHQCRVRQNHIHFYNGEGNPLPDGLLVRLYFDDSRYNSVTICPSQDINWDSLHYIKGFEVIRRLSGYKYAWEKE